MMSLYPIIYNKRLHVAVALVLTVVTGAAGHWVGSKKLEESRSLRWQTKHMHLSRFFPVTPRMV